MKTSSDQAALPSAAASTTPWRERRTLASPMRVAAALMAASGFAGLGYQIVWTAQFGVWLGHDMAAVLAVVAAFFGGLGLGAHLLGARIAASLRPARWYAGCEAAIGLWGLALTALLPKAQVWMAVLTGSQPSPAWQWTVAFLGTFVLLLPATAAMGATLPAIERVTDRLRGGGHAIGGLYAANTFGALTGVLASAFVLLPWLGLSLTAQVCAAINLLCAAVALRLPAGADVAAVTEVARSRDVMPHTRLKVVLLATGALGIGYEVVVVRVLSQVAQDTVYTFALLLAAYLLGTAAGAAFYQRRLAGRHDAMQLRHWLLRALAAACLLGTLSLWPSEALLAWLTHALGDGLVAALDAEAAIAIAAFMLPTLVMGALFSHLCGEAKAAGMPIGTAVGLNTLGAALAPLVFGVVLVPWLGMKWVLIGITLTYLVLPDRRVRRSTLQEGRALLGAARRGGPFATWTIAGVAVAVGLIANELAFIDMPEGSHVVSYDTGVMATVSVVEDGAGVSRLRIDNRQQEGSNASFQSDARQAVMPLLLHPAPADALFLGLGTGVTAAAAAEDGSLRVDVVELLPEVIAASPHFASALGGTPHTPAAHVMAGDARRFVRTTDKRYDVIVADLFHPARSGAGSLYTVEHFEALRERLRPGGVVCQWLPLHQLDLQTLRSIVHSFTTAFPGASALLATHSLDTPVLGLVARADGGRFDMSAVRTRINGFALPQRLSQLQLVDEYPLLGAFIAGPQALARFGADAPLNTDDKPVVAHRAPFITYAPDSLPRDRLSAVLHMLEPDAADLITSAEGAKAAADRRRLTAYWAARTRFIDVGIGVQPSRDPRAMLAQVREPLLAIVRTSADFRPAYDPLLSMAQGLARIDRAGAHSLLAEMAAANPSRTDADALLRRLDAAPSPSTP